MYKKLFTGLAAAGLLLAGCSSEVPADKKDEPNEQFNVIQNAFNENNFDEAWNRLFDDTLKAYNYRIEIDTDFSGERYVPQEVDGAWKLVKDENPITTRVLIKEDDKFYSIQETDDDTVTIYRYDGQGGMGMRVRETSDGQFELLEKLGGDKMAATPEDREKDALKSLFYEDSGFRLNPVDDPQAYAFTTEDTGTGVVVSAAINDARQFNEDLNSGDITYGSMPLEKINASRDEFNVNLNTDGVIESIVNYVEADYTAEGETTSVHYQANYKVYTYDYDDFKTSHIDNVLNGIADGSVEEGALVTLNED